MFLFFPTSFLQEDSPTTGSTKIRLVSTPFRDPQVLCLSPVVTGSDRVHGAGPSDLPGRCPVRPILFGLQEDSSTRKGSGACLSSRQTVSVKKRKVREGLESLKRRHENPLDKRGVNIFEFLYLFIFVGVQCVPTQRKNGAENFVVVTTTRSTEKTPAEKPQGSDRVFTSNVSRTARRPVSSPESRVTKPGRKAIRSGEGR